jgi:hypothetical protein
LWSVTGTSVTRAAYRFGGRGSRTGGDRARMGMGVQNGCKRNDSAPPLPDDLECIPPGPELSALPAPVDRTALAVLSRSRSFYDRQPMIQDCPVVDGRDRRMQLAGASEVPQRSPPDGGSPSSSHSTMSLPASLSTPPSSSGTACLSNQPRDPRMPGLYLGERPP